jgi:hypothetical protein
MRFDSSSHVLRAERTEILHHNRCSERTWLLFERLVISAPDPRVWPSSNGMHHLRLPLGGIEVRCIDLILWMSLVALWYHHFAWTSLLNGMKGVTEIEEGELRASEGNASCKWLGIEVDAS